MAFRVEYFGGDRGDAIQCDKYPNTCPFCHHSISPRQIYCVADEDAAQVFMLCPNETCRTAFIAYYTKYPAHSYYSFTGAVSQGTFVQRSFSEIINQKSPLFSKIYNEAKAAEERGLKEICGVGYRKALEFLIKDYCIILHPTKKIEIEQKLLGVVLREYVNDPKVKAVAQRATWLGNDETHYIRKWEGKTLQDLKTLIELTLHWIEAEELTKVFESGMPA